MKFVLILLVVGYVAALPITVNDDHEDKLKPDEERIMDMIGHVVKETIPEFEAGMRKGVKEDIYTKVAIELAETFKVATAEKVVDEIVDNFMGHLDDELKVFADDLLHGMRKDKVAQMYLKWMREGAEKQKRGEVAEKFLTVEMIMDEILESLSEASKGLWDGLWKRLEADMKEDKGLETLLVAIAQYENKPIGTVALEFYQHMIGNYIKGAYWFNFIFADKFTKNDNAIQVCKDIRAGILKDKAAVEWIEPRARVLAVLEKVLDTSVAEFKGGVAEWHKKDADTHRFIEFVVKEKLKNLKPGEKKPTEDGEMKAYLEKLEKLLNGAIEEYKKEFATDFMSPDNKIVMAIIHYLGLALEKTDHSDDATMFDEILNDGDKKKKVPSEKEINDFLLGKLLESLKEMMLNMGKYYVRTAIEDKWVKQEIGAAIKEEIAKNPHKDPKLIKREVMREVMREVAKGVKAVLKYGAETFSKHYNKDASVKWIVEKVHEGMEIEAKENAEKDDAIDALFN